MSAIRSRIRALLVGALGLSAALPAPARGQVAEVVRSLGLGSYFADSLEAGALRVVGGDSLWVDGAATLPAGTLVSVRVGSEPMVEPPSRSGETRILLPDRTLDPGTGMFLIPIVVVEGAGLRYDRSTGVFSGTVRVGVFDSLSFRSTAELSRPISFFVSGDADRISPSDPTVVRANLPYQEVTLSDASPGTTVVLNVRTSLHPDGVDIPVPVDRDSVALVASPARAQGLGLEAAEVLFGPAAGVEGLVVRMTVDVGNLRSPDAVVGEDGYARGHLRSPWIGPSTVTARSVAFVAVAQTVEFVFPWIFFLLALGGGMIGAMTVWAVERGRARASAPVVAVPFLFSGLLLGTMAALVFLTGINLLGSVPSVSTSQVAVFVFAAVFSSGTNLTLRQKRLAWFGRRWPGAGPSGSLQDPTASYDIFMSYSHLDAGRVEPLVQRFQEAGWTVWWDRRIPPGKTWREVLDIALEECRVMVVVWSEDSLQSKWVGIEMGQAEAHGYPLVPVAIDSAEPPLEYRHIQAADLRDWSGSDDHPGLASVLAALRSLLGPSVGD
ncbi:MAG: toll/interleukin-1 receptor domain-containing protein [Longimicrobiales bacterium]